AILKTLKVVMEREFPYVNICTDSKSCLMALADCRYNKFKLCPLIWDIQNRIYSINKFFPNINVRFTWCPAHIGIKDNEMVDAMAKEAAISSLIIR
ncbi:hypothetical protein ALC60_04256, partial [Trachymyrmex zeteki]